MIATGGYHHCALVNGAVQCWGGNVQGELGDNTTSESHVPVPVAGLSNVTAISSVCYHTCALLGDGTVRCWGSGEGGRLGQGSTSDSHVPVQVAQLSGATAVVAGCFHTCAIVAGGAIKCWGDGLNGQLGNGGLVPDNPVPVNVKGLTGATAIALGTDWTCAILESGAVKCWGANDFGQLGNGSIAKSSGPVDVVGIANAKAISAGYLSTCVLTTEGGVKCWGASPVGQLGDGTIGVTSIVPVDVIALSNVIGVSVGPSHACAARSGAGPRCWGNDSKGQLGDDVPDGATGTPVTVQGL